MPKYLIQGHYTEKGLDGILKEGGSSRRDAVVQVAAQMGGTLEAFYFGFGVYDFILILDLPSEVAMTAVELVARATGMVKSGVMVLLTPEEVDQAVKTTVKFRPPGQ